MRMHGSVRELLSHMEMVGLASIVSAMQERSSGPGRRPVVLGWEAPDTMSVSFAGEEELTVDTAASCVREYLDLLASQDDVIRRCVTVAGNPHSPLSPRIAKSMTAEEWSSYQDARDGIIDEVEGENPLFTSLVGALGFPAYWSTGLTGQKGKLDLDLGASSWEMATRNSGNEFMKTKYLDLLLTACSKLSIQEIAERIRGEVTDDLGKDRNSCGLHAPASLDALMSWVAITGISAFPTRPVTAGSVGSISTAVLKTRVDGRKRTYFVLPVTERPVTLTRYESLCRCAGLYRAADRSLERSAQSRSHDTALDASPEQSELWLRAHGVRYIATFQRFIGGSASCPEYYALAGSLARVAGE